MTINTDHAHEEFTVSLERKMHKGKLAVEKRDWVFKVLKKH